jgi:hypothetical protein
VIEIRRIPASFEPAAIEGTSGFGLPKEDPVVINRGPGYHLHGMEGKRDGYQNLTIGITYTAPAGVPPMHNV